MIRNSTVEWGWPAKLLHWVGAVVILLLLGHGWWMTHLAPRPDRLGHYAGHAALGYDLLALVIIRLVWRWLNPVPVLPVDMKPWEVWAAHASHIAMYALMLVCTVLGWALAGTFKTPLDRDVFGVTVPLIYASSERSMHQLLENGHKISAYILAALVLVHVVAALRHHFMKRNTVLRRMILAAKAKA